jgi:hypothetical protein
MTNNEYHNIIYLGDSVYLGRDKLNRIWLYLDNGCGPHNEICLEIETITNLFNLLKRMYEIQDVTSNG